MRIAVEFIPTSAYPETKRVKINHENLLIKINKVSESNYANLPVVQRRLAEAVANPRVLEAVKQQHSS